MDLLERGFTWLVVAVLVVGTVGAAIVWLPKLQSQATPTQVIQVAPTASGTVDQRTAVLQAEATQVPSPTATVGRSSTPTPSPRPALVPTARTDNLTPVSTSPLAALGLGTNASRTTSSITAPTGVYSYSFTDVATASGASLAFTRIYNSDDPQGTSLGSGWTHSYAFRIEGLADGTRDAVLAGPVGGRQRFARRPDGSFSSPPGAMGELRQESDGYTLERDDGAAWVFDGAGRLKSVTSGKDATTTLTYDGGTPRLIRVSDPDSRGSLSLEYAAGRRLTSVADWLDPPRVVRFAYDGRGRLASVTDREGRLTRYTYHGSGHLLASTVDARGRAVVAIGYDDGGRATSLRDARAKSAAQALTLSYRSGNDGSTEVTRTYPPSGLEPGFRPTSVESYDRAGRLVRRVSKPTSRDEPLTEELAYDSDGGLLSTTRSGGATSRPSATLSGANSSGLALLEVPRPDIVETLLDALAKVDSGSVVHLEDAFGRVSAFETSADLSNPFVRNGTWLLAYDAEDRLRFVKAPSGGQMSPTPGRAVGLGPRLAAPPPFSPDVELRYDEAGSLVEIVEPKGKSTRYRYDERGLLVEARLATGEIREYAYDDRGDPIRARVVSPTGKQQAAEYAFDGLRRLRRVTDYPRWPDRSKSVVAETVYDDRGGSIVVTYQR